MKFNLWFDGECEERLVDVGALLRWLGELRYDYDVVCNIKVEEAHE